MAVLVTVNVAKTATVSVDCPGSTGAVFTSLTITVKLFVVLIGGDPLSVTTVVIVFVLGPCASVGVQVMIPLVSIAAPVGAAARRN